MTETPYSNREIDAVLSAHRNEARLEHENMFKSMVEIKEISLKSLEQATKTNGRVNVLEVENAKQKGFNSAVKWILSFLVPTFMLFLGWVATQIYQFKSDIKDQTHQAVDDALSAYNIKVH